MFCIKGVVRSVKPFLLLVLVLGANYLPLEIISGASGGSYIFSLKWEHTDPYFIDVDSSGNVYVAGRYSNLIKKYNSSGNLLATWGGPGSGEGKFNDPEGIAVDSVHGYVYVTDCDNNRFQKFDLSGTFLRIIGSGGWGDGQFRSPAGIAVDASGNVYVADRENNRIQKFGVKWSLHVCVG